MSFIPVENGKCDKIGIDADGIELSAIVHLPEKTPAPVVVCCHGLLSAKESPKFKAIGETMSEAGFCVLRFDFSGCGESPRRPGASLVETRRKDLDAAIGFAAHQPWSGGQIGLIGSSFGGFLSLLAASERPGLIRTAVSWAAPFDVGKIHPDTKNFEDLRTLFPDGFVLGAPTILNDIGGSGPVLVIHGQEDEIVPWKDSIRIYERLSEPKKLLLMRTADHRVSDASWLETAIRSSRDWFLRYLK